MNPINGAWWIGLPTDPFSHVGFSVAAAFVVHYLLRRICGNLAGPRDRSTGQGNRSRTDGWIFDYRLVIIGAILPDLIDKPLQLWLFPDAFNLPGRSIAHTLVFNYTLVVFSLIMISCNRSVGPLILSLAASGHLLFDRMWETPTTLFWPLYGLSYGHAEFKYSPSWLDWTQNGIGPALMDWTGALVLVIFAVVLCQRRTVLQWFRSGVT